MSKKSDYLFWNLKQLYPTMGAPTKIDEEIYAEMLEPYSTEEIYAAIKSHRKGERGGYVPRLSELKESLELNHPQRQYVRDLPLSPEVYLMREDERMGRTKYFFPDYKIAVNYILTERLRKEVGDWAADKLFAERFRIAVDYGLFADFTEVVKHFRNNKELGDADSQLPPKQSMDNDNKDSNNRG